MNPQQEIIKRWAEYLVYWHTLGSSPATRQEYEKILFPLCEEYLASKKVPEYDRELKLGAEENSKLRQAISLIAKNLDNGSGCSPDCSLHFMTKDVPEEVRLVVQDLKDEIKKLKERLVLIAFQPEGDLFVTRQRLETANRLIQELETSEKESNDVLETVIAEQKKSIANFGLSTVPDAGSLKSDEAWNYVVIVEKEIKRLKGELLKEAKESQKVVDWLNANGFKPTADNTIKLLELAKKNGESLKEIMAESYRAMSDMR